MTPGDKTLKLPPPVYELLRRIAAAEQRNLRIAAERALREYAKKHTPQALEAV